MRLLPAAAVCAATLVLACSSNPGSTCAPSQLSCGGVCTDPSSDPTNCGVCGNACGAGKVCSFGGCVPSCTSAQTACGGSCVDVKSSAQNCGTCGHACAQGETCSNGTCLAPCPSGQTACGGACFDLSASTAHCGACGTPCAANETCESGLCTPKPPTCDAPLTSCEDGGTCVDTRIDALNCGACGASCPQHPNAFAFCSSSACGFTCATGFENCDQDAANGCEVSTAADVNHCGACGTTCAYPNGTPQCANGTCAAGTCDANYADCDGTLSNGCEADLRSNTTCGACNVACSGGQVCLNGSCQISPVMCSNGSSTDCNPAGSTLIATSAFVDPTPPTGWTQCFGFKNTAGDDIGPNAIDNCLNATQLRVRVWDGNGMLEEDVDNVVTAHSSWPTKSYLGPQTAPHTTKVTYWGFTTYYTMTDGTDACWQYCSPPALVFGSGNGSSASIVPNDPADKEYRINCGGMALPGRTVAIYK